jgi:hypothetical protein
MQTTKDPLAPLRTWKELFFGDRSLKSKRLSRPRRRFDHQSFSVATAHAAAD